MTNPNVISISELSFVRIANSPVVTNTRHRHRKPAKYYYWAKGIAVYPPISPVANFSRLYTVDRFGELQIHEFYHDQIDDGIGNKVYLKYTWSVFIAKKGRGRPTLKPYTKVICKYPGQNIQRADYQHFLSKDTMRRHWLKLMEQNITCRTPPYWDGQTERWTWQGWENPTPPVQFMHGGKTVDVMDDQVIITQPI